MAVDRKLLQQALQQGEDITTRAIGGQGFDPRGGWGVAAAQIGTALVGAYSQNKAKKALLEEDQGNQQAFASKFPQFAGLAGNLSRETRDAITMKASSAQIDRQFGKPVDTSGGATGILIDRYMRATGASFDKALAAVQGLARKGLQYDEQGNVTTTSGYLDTQRDVKAAENIGKEVGTSQGQAQSSLSSQQSKLPELEKTVVELSELGKAATYTKAGQAKNAALRQFGLPVGEGGQAAAAYIAKVDNQVLPLLRDTFGAAFTEREGQSLKATLGDINKSPAEKDAVLKAFIEQKRSTIESTKRQIGQAPQQNQQPQIPQDAVQAELKRRGLIK